MKHSLFTLTILTIISISFATNLLKVTKKVKTKTRGAGNTWNSGYDITFQSALGNNAYSDDFTGVTYATRLQSPSSNDEILGWTFQANSTPKGNSANFLTRGSGSNYYVPYRFFTDPSCKYVNPTGTNKYVECWITDDSKKTYRIKVKLPYSTLSYYINDEEGSNMASYINKNARSHRGTVTEAKTATVSASSVYITNKPLQDSASQGGDGLKKSYDNLKQTQDLLKTDVKKNQDSLLTLQGEYNKLKQSESESLTQSEKIKSQLDDLEKQKNAADDTLKSLGSNKTASSSQKEALKKLVDDSLSVWNDKINYLKFICPQRTTDIENANTALLALKASDISANFGKIYPLK